MFVGEGNDKIQKKKKYKNISLKVLKNPVKQNKAGKNQKTEEMPSLKNCLGKKLVK